MKAYFEQLRPIVLSNLTKNLSDFTEIDYYSLNNYSGDFLHAHNSYSTSLILLNSPEMLNNTNRDKAELDFFKLDNPTFILGSAGKIRQISRNRAREIWHGYVPKIPLTQQTHFNFHAASTY